MNADGVKTADHGLLLEIGGEELDVYPPHQSIHSWRDFLIHLATITIGLLIALSLEAGVERLHHRRLVEEALTNIKKELAAKRSAIAKNLSAAKADGGRVVENIKVLRLIRVAAEHPSAMAPFFITNDPSQMTTQEAQLCLERSAELLVNLRLLGQLLEQLDKECADELAKLK